MLVALKGYEWVERLAELWGGWKETMLVDYSVQIRVEVKAEMLVFGLVQNWAVLLVAPMGQ
jgi:hypothetical protein